MIITITELIGSFIFAYFTLACIVYSVLLVSSFPRINNMFRAEKYGNIGNMMNSEFAIPVSIIMPTYNWAHAVPDSILNVLKSDYKNIELIVVDDKSTDNTIAVLIQQFDMYEIPKVIQQKIKTTKVIACYKSRKYPNLILIAKEHGDRGDTLNVGINCIRTPIYITIDADTVVDKDAISKMVFAFISKPHCIVVGGAVYINNDNPLKDGEFINPPRIPITFAPAIQVCQYLRSFLFGHIGWSSFGGALAHPGAFTLMETQAVLAVGGYDTDNYSQDTEIILKLHKYMRKNGYPYSIDCSPTAIAWTDVPTTMVRLWKQRDKWQRGSLRSFWLHRDMCFNPRYKIVGLFSYPFFLAFEILYPFIEILGLVTLIVCIQNGDVSFTLSYYIVAFGFGYCLFVTVAEFLYNSLTFNKYSRWTDLIKVIIIAIIDMLFLRIFLLLCNLFATFHYCYNRLRGKGL